MVGAGFRNVKTSARRSIQTHQDVWENEQYFHPRIGTSKAPFHQVSLHYSTLPINKAASPDQTLHTRCRQGIIEIPEKKWAHSNNRFHHHPTRPSLVSH